MRVLRIGVCAVLTLLLSVPLLAQSSQNAPADPAPQSSPQAPAESEQARPLPPSARSARMERKPPCWREAGIAPATMNQRWQIEDSAKGKIRAVCSDSSLAPDKKHEQIRQINEQTEQEIANIIPAKQFEAFKTCQAERDRENTKRPGGIAPKQLGPCGGVIPAQPGTPQRSHAH
jgi:hypothetical protein